MTSTSAQTTLTCGHAPTRDDGIGTGYASDWITGATYCYPCADARERAAFADASMTGAPFAAYVSAAGDLTTWTGGVLASRVTAAHGVSRSGWHGSEVHSWRFRAADGSFWYGRNGGPGMVITVRRAKH